MNWNRIDSTEYRKGRKSLENTENAHHDTILLSGELCLACAMQQIEVHLALKEATDFDTVLRYLRYKYLYLYLW